MIKDNNIKILIEGNLSTKDTKSLHEQLNLHISTSIIDIEFKETEYLPYIIVKDLLNFKHKINIETSTKPLYMYLTNLGIKNDYKYKHQLINTQFSKSVKAIAIGGSAGSVPCLIDIIKNLPFNDISIFVCLHILPDRDSLLSKILQNMTDYTVVDATDNLEIQEHTIYIAPPDYHMIINNNCIFLSNGKHVNFSRPSISVMFDSLAYEYKNSLLSILLGGYGHDGTSSMQVLNYNKSEVLIQNPDECEAKDMLENAIKESDNPQVLNLKNIQSYLELKLSPLISLKSDIEDFLQKVFDRYGYDYRNYELKFVKRRIEFVMLQVNVNDFTQFKQMVLKDKNVFKNLKSIFSINITRFFRNSEVFKKVYDEVLPSFAKQKYLRVWCSACSRGDEAYSVAILLKKFGLLENAQIYATDINETILNEASNGIYPIELFESFNANYKEYDSDGDLSEYFNFFDGYFEVNKEIKEKILFFKHNLVSDSSINEFDIIFCRNVLIYFDKDLKEKVFQLVDKSLTKDGFLILGESESFPDKFNYDRIGNKKIKIYKNNK